MADAILDQPVWTKKQGDFLHGSQHLVIPLQFTLIVAWGVWQGRGGGVLRTMEKATLPIVRADRLMQIGIRWREQIRTDLLLIHTSADVRGVRLSDALLLL